MEENIFDSWLINSFIAHRGIHNNKNVPENSLTAFKLAIEKGYPIELDIRMLNDGTIIVFHDELMSRMTNANKYIQNLTKADLDKFRLLNTQEKIPTFEEVLNLVNGQVPLLIEIKKENTKTGDFERKILKMLSEYNGEYAIQTFNPYVLEWFKNNAPHIKRGILASYFKGEKMSCIRKFALKRLYMIKKYEPDFISYDCRNLPNRFVNRHKNLPLLAWTVKSQEQYEKVIKYCDNIIFQDFEPKI